MGYRQYETLIPQDDYLPFGLVATIIGFFMLSYFFIYQIAYKTHERSLKSETGIAFLSSVFLSIGVTLLFLSVGIYL